MFPSRFLQERAELENAIKVPRFPKQTAEKIRKQITAYDRAAELHKVTGERLAEARQLDKIALGAGAQELAELLTAKKLDSVPLELCLEVEAQADALALLEIAYKQTQIAVRILEQSVLPLLQFDGKREWISQERVRLGASGMASDELHYLAQSSSLLVQVPAECVKTPNWFGPEPSKIRPSFFPVITEIRTRARDGKELQPETAEELRVIQARSVRDYWVHCCIALGRYKQTPDLIRITEDWEDRAALCREAEAQFGAANSLTPAS